jgi:hypothetical protein
MKKNHELTVEEAMEINACLYEAHGGLVPRTIATKVELPISKIEGHLKILEKYALAYKHVNQWRLAGAGFTAYANIMCGNPGEL